MHDDTRSRLIAELQQLEDRDARALPKDLRDSLTCWHVEEHLRANSAVKADGNRRLTAWVRTFLEVETFIAEHGALPRENNRKPQDAEEVRLAFWLRYQRRRSLTGSLCSYQRVSLDALDEFSWAPTDDSWNATFDEYERFLERESRAPRYRAADMEERRLAAWAAKQRYAAKQDRLDESRIDRLSSLSIRILPTRGTPRSN